MSEIKPFEFEHDGISLILEKARYGIKFCGKTDDPPYTLLDWAGSQTITGAAIEALLAERTRHKDVFARLMEVAWDMAGTFTPMICDDYSAQLNSLQAEWERGGA